jgi:hypothetical protein
VVLTFAIREAELAAVHLSEPRFTKYGPSHEYSVTGVNKRPAAVKNNERGDDKVLLFRNIISTNHFDSGVDPGTSKRRARETSNTKTWKI